MKNNYEKMKDHLYNGEVAYKIGYGNDYNNYLLNKYKLCMECFRMLNQVVYTHCGGSKCPYYEQVMARKKRVKSVNEANKNEKEEV